MLYMLTGGNSWKKLQKSISINNEIYFTYQFHSSYKLIIPMLKQKWDAYNLINTTARLTPFSSTLIFKFIINSFLIIWQRIIFRGKGFRIRNFQSELKITFNFGHSHWTRLKFYKNWFFWKIKRQSYVVITDLYKKSKHFKLSFPYVKKWNRYTMRGLRLKQQAIVRRFGKISQYISSLH